MGYLDEDAATPVKRRHLTLGVTYVERGKPVFLPLGRRIARDAVGDAGMGCWRKRMPVCNGLDRGSNFALTRKGADFQAGLE